MKGTYFLLSFLLLSLIANAIFIPRYLKLHSSSHKINPAIVTSIHDANDSLQKYEKTHSAKALGDAAMKLLGASGQLEQYSSTANDGVTNEFGIMLGNLGGDLVLKRNVKRDSGILDSIYGQLPTSASALKKFDEKQSEFDNRFDMILKQFPPAQYNLY